MDAAQSITVHNSSQPLSVAVHENWFDKLQSSLVAGGAAVLETKYKQAKQQYDICLHLLTKPPIAELQYAIGRACLSQGALSDINNALEYFKKISEGQDSKFPLMWYGIGIACMQFARYPEALKSLQAGLECLGNTKISNIFWPGTSVLIEESCDVKKSFEQAIVACRYPPKPNGVCRLDICPSDGQREIYSFACNFEGLVTLSCCHHCSIDYHQNCWDKMKINHKLSNKNILGKPCLTPDCDGTLSGLVIVRRQSGEDKRTEGSLSPAARVHKPKGQVLKLRANSEKSLKHKAERKAQRKERRLQAKLGVVDASTSASNTPLLNPQQLGKDKVVDAGEEQQECPHLNDELPLMILKKSKDCLREEHRVIKKKKEKDLRVIDQLALGDSWITESGRDITGAHMPHTILPAVHSLEGTSDNSTTLVSVRQKLVTFFAGVLSEQGPMLVDSGLVLEYLEHCFPPPARHMVARYGGIGNFLSRYPQFSVVNNYLIYVDAFPALMDSDPLMLDPALAAVIHDQDVTPIDDGPAQGPKDLVTLSVQLRTYPPMRYGAAVGTLNNAAVSSFTIDKHAQGDACNTATKDSVAAARDAIWNGDIAAKNVDSTKNSPAAPAKEAVTAMSGEAPPDRGPVSATGCSTKPALDNPNSKRVVGNTPNSTVISGTAAAKSGAHCATAAQRQPVVHPPEGGAAAAPPGQWNLVVARGHGTFTPQGSTANKVSAPYGRGPAGYTNGSAMPSRIYSNSSTNRQSSAGYADRSSCANYGGEWRAKATPGQPLMHTSQTSSWDSSQCARREDIDDSLDGMHNRLAKFLREYDSHSESWTTVTSKSKRERYRVCGSGSGSDKVRLSEENAELKKLLKRCETCLINMSGELARERVTSSLKQQEVIQHMAIIQALEENIKRSTLERDNQINTALLECANESMRARRAEANLLKIKYDGAAAQANGLIAHYKQRSRDCHVSAHDASVMVNYVKRLETSVYELSAKFNEQHNLILSQGCLLSSLPELRACLPLLSRRDMTILGTATPHALQAESPMPLTDDRESCSSSNADMPLDPATPGALWKNMKKKS